VIRLSRRYSGAALVLLGIAVVAVGLHRTRAARFDPCANPAQLFHLAAYGHDYSIGEHFGTGDAHPQQRIDGTVSPEGAGARALAFRVTRSDEPFPIYNQTYLMVPSLPEDRTELRELLVGSDVLPVYRVFEDWRGDFRLTRYLFVLGVEPVRHLLWGGIAIGWQQLIHGTQPVTVFAVNADGRTESLPATEAAAEAWLSAAWSEFRRVCRPDR
jgi:hypothetical protein